MVIVLGAISVALLLCLAVIVYIIARDRSLRGMRLSNGDVRREDVTVSLPDNWMKTFYER